MIYTSRFSNPTLKSGEYTAVRISVGTPRWQLAYTIAGEIKELMPFGLHNVEDADEFQRLYCARLERIGVDRIGRQLTKFEALGKPVVLLCFEDVRKPSDWCHRTMFADWWLAKTGEIITELADTSHVK